MFPWVLVFVDGLLRARQSEHKKNQHIDQLPRELTVRCSPVALRSIGTSKKV